MISTYSASRDSKVPISYRSISVYLWSTDSYMALYSVSKRGSEASRRSGFICCYQPSDSVLQTLRRRFNTKFSERTRSTKQTIFYHVRGLVVILMRWSDRRRQDRWNSSYPDVHLRRQRSVAWHHIWCSSSTSALYLTVSFSSLISQEHDNDARTRISAHFAYPQH